MLWYGISYKRKLLAFCVADSYLIAEVDVKGLFVAFSPVCVTSALDFLEVTVVDTVLTYDGVSSAGAVVFLVLDKE